MRQRRIERRHRDGRRESKEKAHFCNYANGARGLSDLGRPMGFSLRERRGQREPAGPKAEWAARSARPKARKKNFRIKIRFLNLPRLWKFVEGDLGGILTCGFFLNSSRLLKNFRKI
jgi:hypothetical protein